VGKNLMWDNGSFASALFEHPLNEFKGIQVTRLIHDHYRADPKRGFYGGGGIDARFNFYPAGFALFGMPPDAPKWGAEYKKMLATYFVRTMSMLAHSTSLPMEKNTVTLDPEKRDAWGLPAVRITYDPHPDDVTNMKWLLEREYEIFAAMGAKKMWAQPVEMFSTNRHLMGTCRMGSDPKRSVVNSHSRTHDVPNLFVVDGSNFVTCARQQPTATIQALAYRAADYMTRAAKAAELG
jgi:choline dehydrogenase-like flavoprotein